MSYLGLQPEFPQLESVYAPGEIALAEGRIRDLVHCTPVLGNRWLNDQLGCQVYFKCEHFQRGGAFKIRGASHAVSRLSEAQAQRGVVTHSSGNHAQALAIAAKNRGIPCTVVMPENSPAVKMQATRDQGATIITCSPTQAARVSTTQEVIDRSGATLVHPFDHPDIILGQATAAWELLHQQPDLDLIVAPVGGGGLLSGTCLAARHFKQSTPVPVLAAEPAGADDAYRSLQSGLRVVEQQPQTIADGLLTTLGEHTWPIIRQHLSGIVTVSDGEIIAAMQIFWERLKWVVEPSGAVSLAGLLQVLGASQLPLPRPAKIGVIISGGNRNFTI